MFSRKADGPLMVQIPGPTDDRPGWTRVAVIAAVGFVVGVAWPKLVGVRLGPSVPEAASTTAVASAAAAEPLSPSAPGSAAALPAVAAAPAPAPSPPPAPTVTVTVGHGVVFACKTSDGDTLKGGDCGGLPGLDTVVMPRLRKLAECAEASDATGKLHLVVHLDFPRGGASVDLGRGHGVTAPDALLACAKADLGGASFSGITHDNPRYSVAYSVTFGPGAAGAATPGAAATASAVHAAADDGTAQVVWEVAIVRDAPKTGKVIVRLQRGAELRIGAPRDGWYPVKYGDGFANEGWVYRGAIGK